MKKGTKLTVLSSIGQAFFVSTMREGKVYKPTEFFKDHKAVYEHIKCYNKGSKEICVGKLDGIDYSDSEGPFYNLEGYAVTGSGGDQYMKWEYVGKMPNVYY